MLSTSQPDTVQGRVQSCTEVFTMTKTKFNQSEIKRITGKSRTTIKKHLDDGELSFTLNNDGKKVVDWSELERVYGADNLNLDKLDGKSTKQEKQAPSKSIETAQLLTRLLDEERSDRRSEREASTTQIEELQERLKEAHKISLIEDQRGEQEKAKEKSHIEDLQDRIKDLKKATEEQGASLKKKDQFILKQKLEMKRLRGHVKQLEKAGFFWSKPKIQEQNEALDEVKAKEKAS